MFQKFKRCVDQQVRRCKTSFFSYLDTRAKSRIRGSEIAINPSSTHINMYFASTYDMVRSPQPYEMVVHSSCAQLHSSTLLCKDSECPGQHPQEVLDHHIAHELSRSRSTPILGQRNTNTRLGDPLFCIVHLSLLAFRLLRRKWFEKVFVHQGHGITKTKTILSLGGW